MEIRESPAYEYAVWAADTSHRITPVYVKKQAKDWIDIVEDRDEQAYFDGETFLRICKLLKLITHPDLSVSMFDGMESYAWFLIIAIFCTKSREDDSRWYQTVLLEICRKNFKTFYSAVIFIIGMLIEPRFSRFFSVAPDFKLSNELRLALRKIVKVSPALEKYFKINRDMIICNITDIEYQPLAYSNDRMDGKLATIYLADEAGAMDGYPIEAMRSSQITIENKLGIIISTQYPNDNNAMIDEIDYAKKVLDRLIDNRRIFALLYEPDTDIIKDWMTDDLVIYQSNPVAVSNNKVFEAIVEKRAMAVLYENKRENYLCKHNNIMYKGLGVEGYIEISKVIECSRKVDDKWWRGKKVYLGLDFAHSDDNVAVAIATTEDEYLFTKVWGFIPKDKVDLKTFREKVDYKRLIKQGSCFACGDDVIDYTYVEEFVLKIEETLGVDIVQIGYDIWNALSSIQKFENEGYECVEIKQHSSVLHRPTKLLKEQVLSKKFQYDENRMLEINFQNARCTEDTNLNKYVNKKKSVGKVDMVVSVINATYLIQQEQLFGNGGFVVQVG